jgi:hypothetical protein
MEELWVEEAIRTGQHVLPCIEDEGWIKILPDIPRALYYFIFVYYRLAPPLPCLSPLTAHHLLLNLVHSGLLGPRSHFPGLFLLLSWHSTLMLNAHALNLA